MKLYGAQGVSPQVLLAYALSHGYQLSPPPALARTPLGKPYFPQYPTSTSTGATAVPWCCARCLTPLWELMWSGSVPGLPRFPGML